MFGGFALNSMHSKGVAHMSQLLTRIHMQVTMIAPVLPQQGYATP
jgi:hypothetical protein